MKKPSLQQFIWQGIDAQGFRVQGKLMAGSAYDARIVLSERHITVLRITRNFNISGFLRINPIKPIDITEFNIEISVLISSGIPLTQALHVLAENTTKLPMKALLQSLKQQVENGNLFSDALKTHAGYFDPLFYHLVYAGECSGMLDVVLQYMAMHREKIAALKQKIKKALFYPCMVLMVAVGVTSAMLIFVIPQFERLFQSMGADLPVFTRWVLNTADWLKEHAGVMIIGSIFMAFSVTLAMRRSIILQGWRDRLLLKIPLLGKMLLEAIFARCFRTLATTLKSGLPLLDSLQLTANIAGNDVYRQAFLTLSQYVKQGQSVQGALQKTQLFPSRVIQMVSIGEESGRLEGMLEKLSHYFETQVDYKVQNLSQLLEPVLMIFLCLLVGSLVIAMYLPIFRLGAIV